MKFSLRWLMVGVFLICMALGTRETIRSYHWHRSLPVDFHLASNDGKFRWEPAEGSVRFGKAEVERARKRASRQRHEVVSMLLRNFQEGGVGLIPSQEYGPKLRELLIVKVRDRFQHGVRLNNPWKLDLFEFWICLKDPESLEYTVEVLGRGNSEEIRQLVRALDDKLDSAFLDDERILNAITRYLQNDEVAVEVIEQLLASDLPFGQREIVDVLGRRDRTVLSPHSMPGVFAVPNAQRELYWNAKELVLRMKCLAHCCDRDITPVDAFRLVMLMASEAEEMVGTSAFEDIQVGEQFSITLSEVYLYLRSRIEEPTRKRLADFAFQINDFRSFLILATDNEQEKVKWLFSNRRATVCQQTSYLWQRNDEEFEAGFCASLPNPKSGLDCPCAIEALVKKLALMDPAFAKPLMLELMNEGSQIAFVECGRLWENSEDPHVVAMLTHRLESMVREYHESMNARSGRSMIDPRSRERQVLESLEMVSRTAAARYPESSFGRFEFDGSVFRRPHPRSPPSIPKLKLFLQRAGMDTSFEYSSSRVGPVVHETFAVNGRLARWSDRGQTEPQCESLLNASRGVFEPDIFVEKNPNRHQRYWVEVALDDCVYRFHILGDRWFTQLQLCDIFNHILERKRIGYRFIPVGRGLVYFGKPELFNGLQEHFGIKFLVGADAYLESGSRGSK